MEKRIGTHNIRVTQSESGVKVHSVLKDERKKGTFFLEEFKSFDEARDTIRRDLEHKRNLSIVYGGLLTAGMLTTTFLALKDIVLNIENIQGGIDQDIPAIIGLLGVCALTKFAESMNKNSIAIGKRRYLALKEAQESNLPQYQKEFPLLQKD